jgi:mycothione reductase
MKNYDVVVVGSGCGMSIVDQALAQGLKVALIDKGPLGGTCLNLGCIPSKALIFPADRIVEVRESRKLGIDAEVRGVDFGSIMQRMRKSRQRDQAGIRRGIEKAEGLDFYEGEGHFVGDYTLEARGETVKARKVFLASGSRILIPPIKGLEDVEYLTSEKVLALDRCPKSIVIVGGGYVAVEYAHFFAAMGAEITILEMLDRIAQSEEPEISDLLKRKLSERMAVHTNMQVNEVRGQGSGCRVLAEDTTTGETREFEAERVLVAVGRRSNADLLKVQKTGVEVDERGYIRVDEYLETSRKNIFAAGDANGRHMFLHVANVEAPVAWNNAVSRKKLRMDYSAVPHAVYSYPQIASVGMTEEQAASEYHILVGRARYFDTAKGEAMMEEDGFTKAIVDEHTGQILGFHIIGPHAPVLIQEVTNAMATETGLRAIEEGMHIHPALPELIQRTFANLEHA